MNNCGSTNCCWNRQPKPYTAAAASGICIASIWAPNGTNIVALFTLLWMCDVIKCTPALRRTASWAVWLDYSWQYVEQNFGTFTTLSLQADLESAVIDCFLIIDLVALNHCLKISCLYLSTQKIFSLSCLSERVICDLWTRTLESILCWRGKVFQRHTRSVVFVNFKRQFLKIRHWSLNCWSYKFDRKKYLELK